MISQLPSFSETTTISMARMAKMWTEFFILVRFHLKEMVLEAGLAKHCSRKLTPAIPVLSLRSSGKYNITNLDNC